MFFRHEETPSLTSGIMGIETSRIWDAGHGMCNVSPVSVRERYFPEVTGNPEMSPVAVVKDHIQEGESQYERNGVSLKAEGSPQYI